MPRRSRPTVHPAPPPHRRPSTAEDEPLAGGLFGADEPVAVRWGERLRRLALGLTVALVCARWYWPGEASAEGDGLVWTLAVLLTASLGLAASWAAGGLTGRWSWADAAVLALASLTGLASREAPDRRDAVNVAWQMGGVAVAYLLLRALPRGRSEIQAIAGALLATAVALSVYGFFQVVVEDPELAAMYQRDPERTMRLAGVGDDPISRQLFHQRIAESKEPRSTFALTNSLAGVLVGPAVLGLGVLLEAAVAGRARRRRGWDWGPVVAASVPLVVVVACLLLTKSRSAAAGFVVGLGILALRLLPRVRLRTLALSLAGVAALVAVLFYAGLKTRQLDREVWLEAPKSLQTRLEYWQASWALLNASPRVFWTGIGPGSFGTPYLRHKLATSSEEIADPHNMVLETWSNAGLPAVVLLLGAIGLGLWSALAPSRTDDGPDEPPAPGIDRGLWLWGAGSLVAVWGVGSLNPLTDDSLARWLVLLVGWGVGAILIALLWSTTRVPAAAAGAGAAAVAVNLLAAGGISMAPVSLGLWGLLAIGQDLRDDRPCGRIRQIHDRLAPFVLAFLMVAMLGTFLGAIVPFWQSESAREAAEAMPLRAEADVAAARSLLVEAARLDPLNVRPWTSLAGLEYRAWAGDLETTPPRNAWEKIHTALDRALAPPRNPLSLRVVRQRLEMTRRLLADPKVTDAALRDEMKADLARSSAVATRLYPTSAILRARHAEAAAGVGQFATALAEADAALQLSDRTPHLDTKLPPDVLETLRAARPGWEAGRRVKDGP
jgi:O-antigen ligase